MKPAPPKAHVYFRSLGCPKNQVDTEVMLAALATQGYVVCETLEDADAAVINTCSFIQSAREESIEAILEVAELREEGQLRSLLVTGCLPQRYGADLARELPEVDAFIGTGEFPRIAEILSGTLQGKRGGIYVDAGRTHLADQDDPRLLIGSGHSAYLKIAEGCDRVCAFCAIPGIRGKFQSRAVESLVQEAAGLGEQGVFELNLISQDTTSYGKDRYGRPQLAELITAIDQVDSLGWIRLLYLYPSALSDQVIAAIAGADRVLPYVDVPLQHGSDAVLNRMRRGVTRERQRQLVARLRAAIPDLVLRTTFIVGFPGETDDDFKQLLDFVEESAFDRVGVFRYSDEEDTEAESYAGKVPRALARERYQAVMETQREIMRAKLEAQVGQEAMVLVDQAAPGMAVGRHWGQAPEIDGQVFLRGGRFAAGDQVRARISGLRDVDLEAEPLEVH